MTGENTQFPAASQTLFVQIQLHLAGSVLFYATIFMNTLWSSP